MKHRIAAVFVVIFVAIPAFARVLSYAPYSNRTSLSGHHERTSRHFVLIESLDDSNAWFAHQLVLYDSTGATEPRVVYPVNGGSTWIRAAALYERKNNPTAPPMLLVNTYEQTGSRTLLSADGGATWKEIVALRDRNVISPWSNDFGGPWTYGVSAPIRIGTDAIPFVVSYSYQQVAAITASGEAQILSTAPWALAIGQDRTGSRVLLRTAETIELVDITGTNRKVFPIAQLGDFSGWITPDDSVYLQMTHTSGRFLYLLRDGQPAQFIAGPYDVAPLPLTMTPPYGPSRDPMLFFAVPTHDFNGAWLLQRAPGKPTTLSRHTPAGGTQTMWSDVSGPEVEALIAGASGDKLLVQVHRNRSVQMQRPFIDPALAIWKTGEPAPRAYDELYLNEEWNKGFVHVDVDHMAAGAPFVFNSGVTMLQEGGDISSPVGGGGDVVQEWGVVRGSLKQHLVLPGVARLHGAFASRWLTDVTIHNPLDAAQDVEVTFMALGEGNVQGALYPPMLRQKTLTLQPHEIRFIPDVLQALFDIGDGGGALHFVPASGMNVFGRTYSIKAGGGTFGFGMQAIDFFNTASPRFPVTFAGAFPGRDFRTNVLLTDTSGRGAEAALNAFGVSGPLGTAQTRTIDAPPGGVLQFNGLGSTLGLFSTDAGGLVVQPTRGTAIATVVAIDNRTNDPTYFPPDLPAGSQVRAIPVIGHVDGANNSHFRSDLYLFNPGSMTSTVTLEARQWDGGTSKLVSFTLLPREARVVRDSLPTLFQMTGLARLRYWSNSLADGVRVTSRTYTIDDGGSTYGSLIPTLNNFQIAGPGDRLEILGISGGSGFRTNVGLVDLSPGVQMGPATLVRIRVLDQHMTELDAFTVTVPSAGGMQVNDIFGARNIAPPEAAMLVVEVLSGGLIGSYATLVDNVTNDSTYLAAHLGAKEN